MSNNTDIVDLFADIVANVSHELNISYLDSNGKLKEIQCPEINYTFGNAQYIKDKLDILSKSPITNEMKFPLIALFCPIKEIRDDTNYYTTAKLNLIIACSSLTDWTNEERLTTSFKNILRPIYNRLLDVLKNDRRFDWGYNEIIKHEYSENYSYGRYGAYTDSGDKVSEPIDAIDLRNLQVKINNLPNCIRQ